MSLLTPLGLLGLVGLIVLIIIYIIKPNYQNKIISSTYIWKLSLRYRKKKIPMNKLRNILLFICQLAILAGAAFISMGVLVSALTENQFIAAFGTMAMIIPFLFASSLNTYINNEFVRAILSGISITARYASFAAGIFDWAALLYYFSLCGVFLFLTVRVLEKRRWS